MIGESAMHIDSGEMDFPVDPSETVLVESEELKLSQERPQRWHDGTKLKHLQTLGVGNGTPAWGAINPSSVVVRKGGVILEEGRDYILDHEWGSVGLGPESESRVTSADTVTVDYSFSLLRIDSIIKTPDSRKLLKKGISNLTVPAPPFLETGESRVANVFVPYYSDGSNAEIFPVQETPDQAVTHTTPGRLPQTMTRIEADGPVRIVCWGDSVTAGGDASSPDKRYTAVFERKLKEKFPKADITVETVAVGGSNSRQWLRPDEDKRGKTGRGAECIWGNVVNAKPDLVTVEFVNDAGFSLEQLDTTYTEILSRIRSLGAEVIFITPHFTMMQMIGFKTMRDPECRPYVSTLRGFAERNSCALADASSRWAHLWKEGIPYITLLKNAINHPDDRGHEIFADELLKCFA